MKNIHTTLIIVLLLVIITLVSCKDKFFNTQQQTKTITTKVETTLIVKDEVIRYHNIPAVLIATNRANLAFQLSGTVDHVMVKIGEKVKEGQALMSLYNPNIDPTLNGHLAQLESIKAKIIQVKRDVVNLKTLRKNNSASKNALEQKETDLKDLMAQQKSIQSQIDLAIANQSESIIKAPFDGNIVSINKQQTEFVAAGQVVMTMNQTSDLEVEVNLPESIWKSLKLGDQIKANYKNRIIEFSIVELAKTADLKSHLMKVILQLNAPLNEIIGQQVYLMFPQVYVDVYQLPLEVVVDDGINNPYIFTAVDGLAVKNYIQPLYIESGQVIFNSQLKINDEVVIKGQSKISEGMRLQVMP